MRLFTKFFVIIVFVCGTMSSYAQNINAWSMQYALPELTAFSDFPEPIEQIERMLDEERENESRLKSHIYAVNIETSISSGTSGQWDTIPEKGCVWRIGIRAMNALSLNLLIENFRMQPGMALYVYNPSMTHTAGPFDHRNNNNGGMLPVQSIPGDIIIVEWNIPFQFSIFNFQFSITNVGYGFLGMPGDGGISRFAADHCHVDINCTTGTYWQREKRSVVWLEIKKGTKWERCTGTLINQAVDPDRKKPYILTAHHCISTDAHARETTFVFGYEKPYCKGNTPPMPSGITGSSLIATKKELDFTLLEMNQNMTDAHRPFYAGWNTSSRVPQKVAGIHHPQGEVKKIAVENHPLETGTFPPSGGLICDEQAHWHLKHWDKGVTEQGSSGSPIFDVNHLVVGTLTGGEAVCSNPKDDYYSKFSEQWSKYDYKAVADSGQCLKYWLDPLNKGVTSLWGYDPIAPYEDRCDTLGNIGSNEAKILIPSDGWGYLTGHNNRNWVSFAEKITNNIDATIIGMEARIAKVDERGSSVQFTIWQGSDFPVTPLYVKDTIVPANHNSNPMHIYFEKALKVTDSDFFIGYSIDYRSRVDTFAVYQSAKRPYSGMPTMYARERNGPWMALDEYIFITPPIYSSLGIRVLGRFEDQPKPYHPQFENLKIVFQPDNPIVFVYIEDLNFTGKVECYDISGKRMLLNETGNRYIVKYNETTYLQVELNVSNLPPGVYLIQASDKKKRIAGKFIKL